MEVHFKKIRNVKSPTRAYQDDAGLDFYVPEFSSEFIQELIKKNEEIGNFFACETKGIRIDTNKSILIPSGIIICLMPGTAGIFLNKSGVASKKKLIIGAQVIDSGYRGEVHLDLHNIGNNPVTITEQSKIAQLLIMPIIVPNIIETKEFNNEQLNLMILANLHSYKN